MGHQICFTGSDAPALFLNLAKDQKRLQHISCLITREAVDPAVGGKRYVVAVLSVLLFGSETWVWSSSILQTIRRRFHHRTVQPLANKRLEQLQDGTYVYCPADEALN